MLKRTTSFILGIIFFLVNYIYIDNDIAYAVSVGSQADLISAVSSANFDITITNEIVLSQTISISNSGTIRGGGNLIRANVTGTNDQGIINTNATSIGIFNITSGTVNISNLKIKSGKNSAIKVGSSVKLNLDNVEITNSGGSSTPGGAINNSGTIVGSNCKFSRNVASYAGAVLNSSGKIVLNNSSICENRNIGGGANGGGAFENKGSGILCLIGCTVSNNQSSEIGGAINNYNGTLYIINCTFTGNISTSTSNAGGSVGQNGGTIIVINSVLMNNYENTSSGYISSDLGVYSGHNVKMYNTICGAYLVSGSQSVPTVNQDNDLNKEDDNVFSSYGDSPMLDANGNPSSQNFNRPLIVDGKVPLSGNSSALYGGTNVYVDYSNMSNITIGIKNGDSIEVLVGTATLTEANKLYSESDPRGATGESSVTYYVVKVPPISNGVITGGTVQGDSYAYGTEVTLKVTPNEGYSVKNWTQSTDNGSSYQDIPDTSNKLTYTFNVTQNVYIKPIIENYRLLVSCESIIYGGNLSPVVDSSDNVTGITIKYKIQGQDDSSYSTSKPTDVGNYTVKVSGTALGESIYATANFSISAKEVNISGLSVTNKVYDGNSTATVQGHAQLEGVLSGDNVEIQGNAVGTFDDKNVGTSKSVKISGLSISGEDSKNYLLVLPSNLTASITQKDITVNAKIADKQYDGTNEASFLSDPFLEGVVSGDGVNLTFGVPSFNSVDVGENIQVNVTDFSISGTDYGNYNLIQPSGFTADIYQKFYPQQGVEYVVSTPDNTESGWYSTNPFTITANAGYMLSKTNTASGSWANYFEYSDQAKDVQVQFYVKEISTGNISALTVENYSRDNSLPECTITIGQNSWNKFLNTVTFGLLFKDTTQVTITANEDTSISGIKSIQYQLSENSYSQETGIPEDSWQIYTGPFNESPDKKFFVYAKVTNNAGKYRVVNSEGIVIFSGIENVQETINYTKTTKDDKVIAVDLKGSTFSHMTITDKDDNTSNIDQGNYSISEENGFEITLKGEYLDKLLAGEYIFNIFYNPLGVDSEFQNSEKLFFCANLVVTKQIQSEFRFDDNLKDSYYYGNEPIVVSVLGNNVSGVTFSSSNSEIATITDGNKLNILKPGRVEISAFSPSDESYFERTITKQIEIKQKQITFSGIRFKNNAVFTKVYDSTEQFSFEYQNLEVDINGLVEHENEDIECDFSEVIAYFEDKNAGDNKNLIFEGLKLSGSGAYKYSLESGTLTSKGSITKLNTSISGFYSEDKVYDGTTWAKVLGMGVVDSKIGNDDVVVSNGVGNFNDKNVESNKVVNFSGFNLLGNDANNYECSQPAPTFAGIIAKDLTIEGIKIQSKYYDGLNTASFSEEKPSLSGVIAEDDVSIVYGTPIFTNTEIGENIPIVFNPEFSIEGKDRNNYSLLQPSGITGEIMEGFMPVKDTHYTIDEPDGLVKDNESFNGWYKSDDFTIRAAEGFKISQNRVNNDSEHPWTDKIKKSEDTKDNKEGYMEFYIRDDNTKVISLAKIEYYKKDSISPEGEIVIGEHKWNNFLNKITFGYFFKETQNIKISGWDENSQINAIKYYKSENEGMSLESIEKLSEDDWILGDELSILPDEKFVIYAQIIDNAGNIKFISSDGIVINASKPSIEISTNFPEDCWMNKSDAKISVSIKNELPVLEKVTYQAGDNELVEVELDIKQNIAENGDILYTYPEGVEFAIENLPEGEYDVKIEAVSKINLNSEKTFHVKKDTEKPTILSLEKSPDEAWTNQNVILKISAEDELSGLDDIPYSFDKGESWQISNEKTYEKNALIPVGDILVRDRAGNISEYEKEVIIENIDKLIPSKPSITGFSDSWVNSDVTLTVVASDLQKDEGNSESKIAFFEYSVDDGVTFSKVDWEKSQTFTISEEGDYTNKIVVKVTDNAGNTSVLSDKYTVKIDKSAPEITSVKGNAESWTNQNVILSVEATDNKSGMHATAYSFDSGKTWQESSSYTYFSNQKISAGTIKVKDAVGNEASYDKDIIIDKIDKMKPNKPRLEGASSDWQNQDVTLKVVCDDKASTDEFAKSGIQFFEYSLDKGKSFKRVDWSSSQEFVISNEGDYTDKIVVKVTDNAGNTSNLSDFYTVKINKSSNNGNEVVESFNKVEQKTKIWVEASAGVFPSGSELICEEYQREDKEYHEISSGIDDSIKRLSQRKQLFDICVVDSNGNAIQPNTNFGLVTVRLPIPDNFDERDLEVYRIQYDLPDDEFKEYIVSIDGKNYCEFQTDHFSPYALVDKISKRDIEEENRRKLYGLTILIILSLGLLMILWDLKKENDKI